MRPDLLPTTLTGMLSHTAQECAEVIQQITKIQMFGWNAVDPQTKIIYDNGKLLWGEINDLEIAVSRLKKEMKNRGL